MNIFHRDMGQAVFERAGARNAALIRTIALGLLTVLFAGCMGYVPGRQSYWDAQVKEMCEKDGGVTVYERVPTSVEQFEKMRKVGGYASIPPRSSAKSDDILYWDESVTVLRDANPKVWRSEQLIRRRTDEKVVARVVRYSRIGGDIPSPAHTSHFGCPDEREIFSQRERVFVTEGAPK